MACELNYIPQHSSIASLYPALANSYSSTSTCACMTAAPLRVMHNSAFIVTMLCMSQTCHTHKHTYIHIDMT